MVLQHVACRKIICESKTKWVVRRMTVGGWLIKVYFQSSGIGVSQKALEIKIGLKTQVLQL